MTVEIRIPSNVDSSKSTMYDDNTIVFVEISHYDLCEDPHDWWDMGTIHSFNTQHTNFLRLDAHQSGDKNEALAECRKRYGKDIVVLGYFEHSYSIWHVATHKPAGTEVDYRWDGVSFAGIWVPTKRIVHSASARRLKGYERFEHMERLAAQACELYTYWCNGEVYEYIVRAFNVRKTSDGVIFDNFDDYRYDESLVDDSSCGYYGWDALLSAVKESVKELPKLIASAREKETTCQVQK